MSSSPDHPPADRSLTSSLSAPLRWLDGLGPLRSWVIVMAVIVGLSMVGLRPLAWLVALVWLGYVVYSWVAPSRRRPPR